MRCKSRCGWLTTRGCCKPSYLHSSTRNGALCMLQVFGKRSGWKTNEAQHLSTYFAQLLLIYPFNQYISERETRSNHSTTWRCSWSEPPNHESRTMKAFTCRSRMCAAVFRRFRACKPNVCVQLPQKWSAARFASTAQACMHARQEQHIRQCKLTCEGGAAHPTDCTKTLTITPFSRVQGAAHLEAVVPFRSMQRATILEARAT
jgi:hypothetical protein